MSNAHSIQVEPPQPVDEAMNKALAEEQGIEPEMAEESAPAPEERPQWLPEKFKSPEDLAKAYSELERRFTSEKPKPSTAGEASGGLNLEQYANEYAENGELSQESIQKLVASGIPEPIISNYLEGVRAVSEAQTSALHGIAGGEKGYESMMEWASESLDESEIEAFNDIIEQGDQKKMQMAVRGLHARYVQANGQPAKLVQGDTAGIPSGSFRSVAEVTAAMRDPRYHKDAAYRRDVETRLRNSNILNVTSR